MLAVSSSPLASPAPFAAPRPPDIPFRIQMLDGGSSETAAVADINKDGRLDIVSGEHWYEGPAWTKHKFRELDFSSNYIDGFSDMPVDVDGDGYPDIASVTWFAKKISWFRNPGKGGGAWVEAPINAGFNIEFATLADMTTTARRTRSSRRRTAPASRGTRSIQLGARGSGLGAREGSNPGVLDQARRQR